MAYGTAPRLVNGRWVTRTGRILTPAGQAYWTNLHRQGRTDGQGHINRPTVKPPRAGIGGSTGATVPVEQPTVKPITASQAKTNASPAHQKAVKKFYKGKHGKLEPKYATFLGPVDKISSQFVEDIGQTAINTPASIVYGAEHPVAAGKAAAKSFKESAQHPLRHPGLTFLNLLGAKAAVGGAIGRTEAAVATARAVKP